jgi:hypothetical protein
VERGTKWYRVLRRQGLVGPLSIVAPVTFEVLDRDRTVLLTITGVIAGDAKSASLTISAAQASLAAGRYEHRLTLGDPVLGAPQIVARGFLTVNDEVWRP